MADLDGATQTELERMLADLRNPHKKRRNGTLNPLNEPLVQKLVDLMNNSSTKSEHMKHTYARAIASIKKFPGEIKSPDDAKQLRGIGNFVANKIHMIILKLRENAAPGVEERRQEIVLESQHQSTALSSINNAPPSDQSAVTLQYKLYIPAENKGTNQSRHGRKKRVADPVCSPLVYFDGTLASSSCMRICFSWNCSS